VATFYQERHHHLTASLLDSFYRAACAETDADREKNRIFSASPLCEISFLNNIIIIIIINNDDNKQTNKQTRLSDLYSFHTTSLLYLSKTNN
jgi:hypothetical protein